MNVISGSPSHTEIRGKVLLLVCVVSCLALAPHGVVLHLKQLEALLLVLGRLWPGVAGVVCVTRAHSASG